MGVGQSYGICQNSVKPDPEDVVFLDKFELNQSDDESISTLKMVLFDTTTRAAFIEFLQSSKSLPTLHFYEGIQRLRLMALDGHRNSHLTTEKFTQEANILLEQAACRKVDLPTPLQSYLSSLYYSLDVPPQELVLSKLVEAQDITGKQIRATLPKFETSKAFADFIKYKSQRESSAIKSNAVAEKTSTSIFRISKYEKNNKKIYREPSSNSFQSIRKTLSTLGSKSILIVESSTLTAKILIYHLQQKFNLVVHAVSDKEALSSLLSDTVFEWILFSIDISSDCLSLIAKYTDYCKKHNSTPAKVIGVASDTKSPLVPYALAAGFKTVLMIPFDHNDFMAAIHKAQSEGRSRFLHGTQQGDLEAAAVNS